MNTVKRVWRQTPKRHAQHQEIAISHACKVFAERASVVRNAPWLESRPTRLYALMSQPLREPSDREPRSRTGVDSLTLAEGIFIVDHADWPCTPSTCFDVD